MPSRKHPAKKPRKSKKAVAHKIGYFIRSKRVLIAKKKGGKRIDHKGSRLRKGLRVYKRKSQAQKALKRKTSKKKSRKCKHGVTKSGKCRQKSGGNKGNLSRSRRNYHIRKTSIGNVLYRNTQPFYTHSMTVKQKRAACKRQGLVYDTKTKRCRKRKSGKRKSGKRKSRFRVHRGKKHSGRKRSGWSHKAPMTQKSRRRVSKKNKKCFLGKGMKYPICTKQAKPTCQGVLAAKSRAALMEHTRSPYANSKSRRMAKSVNKKASRLAKKHRCHRVNDHFRGHL